MLHQVQSELQQQKVHNERLQFLADSRLTEYEQAIRDKQSLFKEKLDLDRQWQQKNREFDDCFDDRNNMRAQIFHLLENGNVKGHLRSLPSMMDNESQSTASETGSNENGFEYSIIGETSAGSRTTLSSSSSVSTESFNQFSSHTNRDRFE